MNAKDDAEKRKELQKKRNEKLREVGRKIREIEEERIEDDIEEIEKSKEDSTRMFKAIRKIHRNKPKDEIMVNGEEGQTSNDKEATEIIKFFKNFFNAENQQKFNEVPPTKMRIRFTQDEVGKAIKSLKNNKSAGIDDVVAEQLKYGPQEINQGIADLLNSIAKTGKHPKEVKEGILIPLPKPGKKKGPPGNLRPIILLSMLRKIIAICMIRRTNTRLKERIPVSQAAYSNGRSTTELIFSLKILAEKAITSSSYQITVLLLDMSKAFDTVDRGVLFDDLKEVLEDDELHMISILLKDVQLQVRINKERGEAFTTNVGVPQGDCLSPVLFIFYLAKALNPNPDDSDHNYYKRVVREDVTPPEIHEHTYAKIPQVQPFILNQQYADDIGWMSVAKYQTDAIKKEIPNKLRARNLMVNEAKTEEYTIKRNGDNEWKTCKYVGSLPDTEKDFIRRKGLAAGAYHQNRKILESNKISLKIRLRLFNCYVTSIFMYNVEIWSMNTTLQDRIDAFQRNLLRKMLKIKWPYNISNDQLYNRTEEEKWSDKIKKRRLSWLGHLLRLPPEAPAQKALSEALIPVRRPPGRPKTTWISSINQDLQEIDPTLKLGQQKLQDLAEDRSRWRNTVKPKA